MALSKEQIEDEISQLCSGILEYKIGTYEEFHDALGGEMEGCRLNAAVFGMTGSGKSALINTIFRSLGIKSEPAITQDAGKEGTKIVDPYAVPGTDITLFDTRGFFEMDRTEEGELFRILFGIEQPGEYLTRGSEGAQKSESAGVAAHRLKKPPIVDQMHVILWVIKAVDIRFQMGQYREKIKFVQDQLRKATITIITVITFDDEIQRKENADEEREKLKKKALEVTGSLKKNVFMIANSVEGQEYDSIYRERVLKILELAAKSGERSIRMRQATRENLRRPTRASESDAGVKCPVENTEEPDYPGKKWWSMP